MVRNPPIRAAMVWTKLNAEQRETLLPSDWIYPLYMRLPMGCSHSVHILMAINVETVWKDLTASRRLTEKHMAKQTEEADHDLLSDKQWMERHSL